MYGFFKLNDIPTVMEAEYDKTIQVKDRDIALTVYDTAGEIEYDQVNMKRLGPIDAYLLALGMARNRKLSSSH